MTTQKCGYNGYIINGYILNFLRLNYCKTKEMYSLLQTSTKSKICTSETLGSKGLMPLYISPNHSVNVIK